MSKRLFTLFFLFTTLAMTSCHRHTQVVDISARPVAVTKALDATPDSSTNAIADEYRQRVKEKHSVVIGTTDELMERVRPESNLTNFAADAVRRSGDILNGSPVDFAITNMGGLRNVFMPGDITVGELYNIFPFENSLYLITLTGDEVISLFKEVAAAGGQCISGANLVISADGMLLDATIGEKAIDNERTYRVATIDYLAEGNDGLTTLAGGTDRIMSEDLYIRQMAADYIATFTQKGLPVHIPVEGRIIVK